MYATTSGLLLYKYPQKLRIKIMVEAMSKPEDKAINRTTRVASFAAWG
jgi:hypothetical protein